jgi:hypothetical membrane protein
VRNHGVAALGGVIGPAAFVTAWAVGGAVASERYSPVEDAISRLAAVHAPTRPLMTAGFVAFGIGVPLYGVALRQRLPGRAWAAAVATGLATIGVAALPLDHSGSVDMAHGAFASVGYATLAAVPLLAAGPLRRSGRRRAAGASVIAGVACGASLLATVAGPKHGLFQRAGLTVGDAWVLASAVWLLRSQAATTDHR